MNEIIIHNPLDMHVHLRQGEMLQKIAPLSASTFSGILVMPNTDPPITTKEGVIAYYDEIKKSLPNSQSQFYLTLYFQTTYTKEFLQSVKPHIISIKFYPKGLTTNSHHGCDPRDPEVYKVLEIMEELEIPLNVHPEAEGYYHDREKLFIKYIYDWKRRFPELKIILEHLSDKESIPLLNMANVYGTITPQHLLTTGNDWFGPPFNPHLYCMPCVKRPEDRNALLEAISGYQKHKLMAGTDSAPHSVNRKVQCGCAGVFSAPIALQLYTQALMDAFGEDAPALIQNFLSNNACKAYGLNPPPLSVKLTKEPFTVPEQYHDVVPMWAGKEISWSIKEISWGVAK